MIGVCDSGVVAEEVGETLVLVDLRVEKEVSVSEPLDPGAFKVLGAGLQADVGVAGGDDFLGATEKGDLALVEPGEVDFLDVDVPSGNERISLAVFVLEQAGVAGPSLDVGDVLVRTVDPVGDTDECVAGGAPGFRPG